MFKKRWGKHSLIPSTVFLGTWLVIDCNEVVAG